MDDPCPHHIKADHGLMRAQSFTTKGESFIIIPYLTELQVRLSGDLLGRDGHQVGGARIHPQQLQLPQEQTPSLSLIGAPQFAFTGLDIPVMSTFCMHFKPDCFY